MRYLRRNHLLRFQFGGGILIVILLFLTLFPAKTFAATSWQRIVSPNTSYPSTGLVGVTAITAKDAWTVGSAAGEDTQGKSIEVGVTEHWNGQKWSLVSSPTNTRYDVLSAVAAASTSDVWAVGNSIFDSLGDNEALIEHWNGTKWSLVANPTPPAYDSYQLDSVSAISANDVWAVGTLELQNDSVPLTMHWDGSSWKVIQTPIQPEDYASEPYARSQLLSVTAISTNDVWAVGSYNGFGSPLTIHWNGIAWSIVDPGTADGYFESVSSDNRGDIWAVGGTDSSNTFLSEQWNGSSWQIEPLPITSNTHFNGVKVVSNTSVWAIAPEGVFHWDGTSWSTISDASASDGAYLKGVTSAGGFTGAVGYIGRGLQTTFIEGGTGA
jgi:hypothetical protein